MFARRVVTPVLMAGTAVLVAAGLTGCGGVGGSSTSESSGSLTTMGFTAGDEVAKSRVAAFKDAYPKTKVKINKGSFDPQQFLSALSSGNVPDVVYMDRQLIGTYVAKGALEPMDSCISSEHVKVSDYLPQALQDVKLKGHYYGLPEFASSRIILANKAVLEKTGLDAGDLDTSDWAGLKVTAKKLYASSDGKVTRIGFDPKLPEFLQLWAAANGTNLVDPGGKPNLDDPKVVEALQYAVSLIDEQGGWSKFKAFRDTWDVFGKDNEFAKNQAGAFPWEDWYLNVLVQAGSGDAFTGIPFKGRDGKPVSFETGSAWVIPKAAKHKTQACQWAKTMTSTDTWMKAAAARHKTVAAKDQPFTGLYTGNKTADAKIRAKYVKPTGEPGLDKAIDAYYTAVEYSVPTPASLAGSEIKDAWQSAVNRVLSGSQSPAAAMKKAQADAMSAYQNAGS